MVRVFDPVKDDSPEDWFIEAYNNDFPRSLPDKNVFAPAMDEGVAKFEHQYVRQANKVERWILRQMDIVFAYYYPNLEDSVIAQIEYPLPTGSGASVTLPSGNSFRSTLLYIG